MSAYGHEKNQCFPMKVRFLFSVDLDTGNIMKSSIMDWVVGALDTRKTMVFTKSQARPDTASLINYSKVKWLRLTFLLILCLILRTEHLPCTSAFKLPNKKISS